MLDKARGGGLRPKAKLDFRGYQKTEVCEKCGTYGYRNIGEAPKLQSMPLAMALGGQKWQPFVTGSEGLEPSTFSRRH